ncbi:unnamed protein product [Arabis nemorensis]|uniref:Uncharacterized protein n=1 Tax=Arabis nemorensis TaxID=586526 RepID=A0A565AQ71_9BRAS|nr:unnamed protein product [Arabis nemorensis]
MAQHQVYIWIGIESIFELASIHLNGSVVCQVANRKSKELGIKSSRCPLLRVVIIRTSSTLYLLTSRHLLQAARLHRHLTTWRLLPTGWITLFYGSNSSSSRFDITSFYGSTSHREDESTLLYKWIGIMTTTTSSSAAQSHGSALC